MFVDDLSWMHSMKNATWIRFERISSRGWLKFNTNALAEENMPVVGGCYFLSRWFAHCGSDLDPITNITSQALALKHTTMPKDTSAFNEPLNGTLSTKDTSLSAPSSPTRGDHAFGGSNSLRVGIVVHRAEAGFATRLLSQVTYALPTEPKDRSLIDQKAQISSDTIIGGSTQVSERTTIKKSVIGRHCVIGKMAKIVGAKLEGCILGKNTKIGTKAELSRCVTQAGYEVGAGETVRGEKLDVSDWTAVVEESEDGGDEEETSEEGEDA
ncbi:hypothetical protein C0992_001906 [Termitomyces sp. T32_za158]|nr:hypothetical protein C0992_001906 [Termitomyces sp. T32_za158]